ncbi:hypothetical protein FNV43_RR26447 [Rhamnella rubrinervis]|uniref:VQ domain-containing protein n=1 Tax=Rhamnella rubrinervis TaxID=2594499 RepID=A0A8K0GP89_9ROSA|nr:hypothetical protein FNV43_RR26447 [Rhamnella rubrinervis]
MRPAKFNDEDQARRAPASAIKQRQQRQPVIIYTHSPKIIHTQARDFMALVQKLTGVSRPDCDDGSNGVDDSSSFDKEESGNRKLMGGLSHENDNESSSVLTDEINGGGNSDIGNSNNNGGVAAAGSNNSMLNLSNPYFGDVPLFTPNGSDFFCSSRSVYRFPDTVYPSPNMGSSLSPSFLEFMKGLPEY